jgi:hypothetical protein
MPGWTPQHAHRRLRGDTCRAPNLIDLTGTTFGKLLVLRLLPINRKTGYSVGARYLCRCACGTELEIYSTNLIHHKAKTCGPCSHSDRRKPAGVSAFNTVLCTLRNAARKRDLKFLLSVEQVRSLTSSNCYYCGCLPMKVKTRGLGEYHWNGLDRVDSDGPYSMENVVPCCEMCNRMKREFDQQDFLRKVEEIWRHQHP